MLAISVCIYADSPTNKRRFRNSFTWFIFNLQRRKIYTVVYNIKQCTVINMWGFQMQKIPYLGRWPSVQGCKLPSTPAPHWESTPTYPTSRWLHPFPWSHHLRPAYPHMWYYSKWQKTTLAHRDLPGTMKSSCLWPLALLSPELIVWVFYEDNMSTFFQGFLYILCVHGNNWAAVYSLWILRTIKDTLLHAIVLQKRSLCYFVQFNSCETVPLKL
jgi:hypothetical protein